MCHLTYKLPLWRVLLVLLACIFSIPSISHAAVALDAKANAKCTDTGCTSETTLTYAMTVGSGATRQLVTFAYASCGSAETPPTLSATYAGQALTSSVSVTAAGRKGYAFTWPTGSQPTSGTNNVVVTASSSLVTSCSSRTGTINSGTLSVTGADQTTILSSSNTNSGSGTSATVTITTSGANDLGISGACAGNGITSTTETIQIDSDDTQNACASLGVATAAGGDLNFSYTIPSDNWGMIAAAFKADTGGSPSPLIFWQD